MMSKTIITMTTTDLGGHLLGSHTIYEYKNIPTLEYLFDIRKMLPYEAVILINIKLDDYKTNTFPEQQMNDIINHLSVYFKILHETQLDENDKLFVVLNKNNEEALKIINNKESKMKFKYYTKITEDNINEIWDNLMSNVPDELNKKFYINFSRLREESEYPVKVHYPMKTYDDFITHIKKADHSIIFNDEFEKEFRLFENDYMIMYNENSSDFNIDKIKEKLLNLYFENDLAKKERREYISNTKI